MKKIALFMSLSFAFISGAFATNSVVDQINIELKRVLAPLQNDNTIAELVFNNIDMNSDRVQKVSVNGLYRKVGSNNVLEVKMDNLSYNYGDGVSPTTIVKGSIGFDFTKVLSQEILNQIIPDVAEIIEQFVKQYSLEYGDAVTVRGIVTSTAKDNNDNYIGLTALITGKVDLTKLPDYIHSEDVIATEFNVSLSVNLKNGVAIDAYIVSNPEYYQFKDSENGLKEMIEKLIAKDDDAFTEIKDFVERLDNLAAEVVEMANVLNLFQGKNVRDFMTIAAK